jgi:hypothetical protein
LRGAHGTDNSIKPAKILARRIIRTFPAEVMRNSIKGASSGKKIELFKNLFALRFN